MPTTDNAVVEKILSHDLYADLDKTELLRRYHAATAATELNAKPNAGDNQLSFEINVIEEIHPTGMKIEKEGIYLFGKDINWKAADDACSAITINTDGVILDMAGHALTATIQDSSRLISGIYIENCTGVTVCNGSLLNMGYCGIQAEKANELSINNMLISGMEFNNLEIRNLCPSGISANKCEGISISESTVQYLYTTSDTCTGIQLNHCLFGEVNNCAVKHIVNYDGAIQGYSYFASTAIKTTDCRAEHLQSHFYGNIRTGGHTVLGFLPLLSSELSFSNCSSTHITGCADDCHGMSLFICSNISVDGFSADYITDGVTSTHTGAKATGLEVYGSDIQISNCTVNNIKAINPQDKQSAGFSVWGADITFSNCKASNVVACDHPDNPNPVPGIGVGFGWAPDPRPGLSQIGATNITYSQCEADNCLVGFDTWNHIQSTWTDISYNNCTIEILIQPGQTRTITANPASECNPPVSVTLTNMAKQNNYPE